MPRLMAPFIVCLCSMATVAIGLTHFRNAWLALLLYHAVLLVALTLRKNPTFDWNELRRGFSFSYVCVATTVFSLITIYLFQKLIALDPSGAYIAKRFARVGLTPATFIPFVVYTIIINPILEETYWRGNYASTHRTAYLNDLCFGLFHLPIYAHYANLTVILGSIAGITLLGLFARMLAKRLDGLATPIIIHAMSDLAVLTAMGFVVFR